MLNKFNLSKNDDGSFDVESKISANKVIVRKSYSVDPEKVLLWTILSDLYEEGLIKDKAN